MEKKSYAEYAAKFLQIPLASNYRSCDSWFVDKQKRLVVFFQVTSSYHHPVCYEGLENVLLKLSQSNQDIFNYEKVLLFVVPDTPKEIMSTGFTKQHIECSPAPILPDSKKNFLFKEVYIHRKKNGILARFGEKSYNEVVEAVGVDEDVLTLQDVHSKLSMIPTKSRNLLYNYFLSISDISSVGATDLKQYVLGISVKD
jgi:hypothetical protein